MNERSLSEKAYDLIKNEIITCVIMPGEQVAQAGLAERFGLGLSPVRSALQRLAQEGFVQAVPRFGYLVSPVTLSDVQELFELRDVLEIAAVRYAADRANPQTLETIARQADFTYVYHDRQSYSDFLARNDQFHRSIASLAENHRLAEAISKVLGELNRVFHLGLDLRDSGEEMRSEHLELVEALLKRDATHAEDIVHNQILRSRERVVEALVRGVRGIQSTNLSQNINIKSTEMR
jgi:DNA-binding GntR family transcriptional regulator